MKLTEGDREPPPHGKLFILTGLSLTSKYRQINEKYGKKRLVIAHETEDLSDAPRFLLTDALHWDITRIIRTWNYRWSVEVFHEAS